MELQIGCGIADLWPCWVRLGVPGDHSQAPGCAAAGQVGPGLGKWCVPQEAGGVACHRGLCGRGGRWPLWVGEWSTGTNLSPEDLEVMARGRSAQLPAPYLEEGSGRGGAHPRPWAGTAAAASQASSVSSLLDVCVEKVAGLPQYLLKTFVFPHASALFCGSISEGMNQAPGERLGSPSLALPSSPLAAFSYLLACIHSLSRVQPVKFKGRDLSSIGSFPYVATTARSGPSQCLGT